jgi:predicted nucleic acid-binding protein
MSPPLNRVALVDTGFWYAALDKNDQYHQDAQSKIETLMGLRYVLPWPTLYETLNTSFARDRDRLRKFERFLKRPNAVLLDDATYRTRALERTLSSAGGRGRAFSLVDNILRLIIEDRNVKLHCLFSYDRRDFVDVCTQRRIELI